MNFLPMILRNMRMLIILGVTLGSIGIVFIVNASVETVNRISTEAIGYYGGDRIPALIKYVDDPRRSFKRRNRAIWALSQLGDGRALPVLEKHVTGRDCRHRTDLCQKELKKAIAATKEDAGPHFVHRAVVAARSLGLL